MIQIPPWGNTTPEEDEIIEKANAVEKRERNREVPCCHCGTLCNPIEYCGRPYCVPCHRVEEATDEDCS